MLETLLRRNPLLYWLTGIVAFVLLVLVIAASLLPLVFKKTISTSNQVSPNASTDIARGNIEILNLLNQFHLRGGQNAPSTAASAVTQSEISELKQSLSAVEVGGTTVNARNDLVMLVSRWEEYVASGNDARDIRDSFISLGEQYPWLQTLLWLIILNRL